MENFIKNNTNIPIENNKLMLPLNLKHIKLDIGLSYNAPNSQLWLSKERDLFVIGFEPHPDNIKSILNGSIKRNELHGEPLDAKYINKNFFLIPCALGLENNNISLFSTINDYGCSSIYEPKFFNIDNIFTVPCFTLKSFFDLFPFDIYPIIEYIKLDAQGSDLDIVKSGEIYIKEHVVIITIEPENYDYKNTINSKDDIGLYMLNIGFYEIKDTKAIDPTYLNKKYEKYFYDNKIYYEQF